MLALSRSTCAGLSLFQNSVGTVMCDHEAHS